MRARVVGYRINTAMRKTMIAVSISEIITTVSSSSLAARRENYPGFSSPNQDENNPHL
jgi:hypothetical protein